jgi:hypothetical protein
MLPTLKALKPKAQGCRVSGYPGTRIQENIINPERVARSAACAARSATLSGLRAFS